uniref:insulinoma-associated protein 1-like n=1 Tax=Ictidomys tridecemlineatus TaxID=43179 RepID=UPI001A9EA548|nr:insulinoma-associated protein 1-like [Ictidomys tridecemlineatus]
MWTRSLHPLCSAGPPPQPPRPPIGQNHRHSAVALALAPLPLAESHSFPPLPAPLGAPTKPRHARPANKHYELLPVAHAAVRQRLPTETFPASSSLLPQVNALIGGKRGRSERNSGGVGLFWFEKKEGGRCRLQNFHQREKSGREKRNALSPPSPAPRGACGCQGDRTLLTARLATKDSPPTLLGHALSHFPGFSLKRCPHKHSVEAFMQYEPVGKRDD